MLFKISNKPLFKENPEILGIPQFGSLPEKVMEWIIWVYDYDSPYRRMPIDQRKTFVSDKHCKNGTKFDKFMDAVVKGEDPKVEMAIMHYQKMQYDDDKESLMAVNSSIRDVRDWMMARSESIDEAVKKGSLAQTLTKLEQEKKKLAEILELRGEVRQDAGEEVITASYIDEYIANENE